ncbi:MerR family transcriptional regulator [Paenibacillus faecis]|uniref:MerR family transcriptional regulator n=1 Tax=Paenibacillus faecis TaxID=862114 RepID=A0A5D0CMD7_9BACL|nr:MerR family transcriptional regulator [Paenibacillus faecis]TYA10465.1 MerR family transcriptional regulator [Paenibacillus faecis]
MYSIGKFSEICKVPVKTLRYYSEIGLLEPSFIDPFTNYRYYDYDKIQAVQKIKLLKSCQFSLAQIREFLENQDSGPWEGLFEEKLRELEQKRKQLDEQMEQMRRLKEQVAKASSLLPGPMMSECCLEEREALRVYTIRRHIKPVFIDNLVQDLFDRVYAFNLTVKGKLMAIFHERGLSQGEADVELLLPVEGNAQIEGCKVLPAGTYACLKIKGPYSELGAGYERLQHWLAEQNLTRKGDYLEIYEQGLVPSEYTGREIHPDLSLPPSELMTKLCVPVALWE